MTHHVKIPLLGEDRTTVRNSSAAAAKRSRGRLLNPALALAAVLPLTVMAGCANVSKDHFTVGSTHHTYKTRHPIVIDEKEQTLDIPVASGSYDLPRAQASSVVGFTSRYKKSASGAITVMMPTGSPNQAAGRTIGARAVDTITQNGVPRHRVRMTTYDASSHGASAPVRLSYFGVKASVTGCGQWREDLAGSNTENENYHNFGCASQSNTAAMISNPADLLGPRGMTEIDAQRRNNVIERYRTVGAGL